MFVKWIMLNITGPGMLCMCSYRFWEDPRFCVSHACETPGILLASSPSHYIIFISGCAKVESCAFILLETFKGWNPSCYSFPYKGVSCSNK